MSKCSSRNIFGGVILAKILPHKDPIDIFNRKQIDKREKRDAHKYSGQVSESHSSSRYIEFFHEPTKKVQQISI